MQTKSHRRTGVRSLSIRLSVLMGIGFKASSGDVGEFGWLGGLKAGGRAGGRR